MNFATHLGSGAIAVRTIEGTHSPQTAKCAQGHVIRFGTTAYGQALEICDCGTRLMRPDPSITPTTRCPKLRTKRQKETRICQLASCGKEYLTNTDSTSTGCSPSHRATLWRIRDKAPGGNS